MLCRGEGDGDECCVGLSFWRCDLTRIIFASLSHFQSHSLKYCTLAFGTLGGTKMMLEVGKRAKVASSRHDFAQMPMRSADL